MDLERDPSLSDIIKDWLFEQNIDSKSYFNNMVGSSVTIQGFGWAIVVEDNNVEFTNRLDNEIIKAPIADPTILDTMKAKISYVESKTIAYIIEHVDDDGWEDWTRKTRQPPPLGPQYRGGL